MKRVAHFAEAKSPTIRFNDGITSDFALPPTAVTSPANTASQPYPARSETLSRRAKLKLTLPRLKKKSLFFFVGGVLLLSVIVAAIAVFSYRTGGVTLSNVTSRSASISWVTQTKSKGAVIVTDSKIVLPFTLANLGGKTYYDDRDVSDARLAASLSTSTPTSEVKVTEFGEYFVHHVTLTNLEPEREYRFWVGDGSVFVQAKFATGNNDYFATLKDSDVIPSPVPVYGKVKAVYTDEFSELSDGVVYFQIKDTLSDMASSVLSSPVSAFGAWYLDTSNAKSDTGDAYIVSLEKSESANLLYNVKVESGPLGSWIKSFEDISEMSPANDIVINVSGDTGEDSSLRYRGVTMVSQASFINNDTISFSTYARDITDDCISNNQCGSGYKCKSGECIKTQTPGSGSGTTDKCTGKTCGCGSLPACPKADDGYKNKDKKDAPKYEEGTNAGTNCAGDICKEGGTCGNLNPVPCFCAKTGYEIYPGAKCEASAKPFEGYSASAETTTDKCAGNTGSGGCVSTAGGKTCLAAFGKTTSSGLKCVKLGTSNIGQWQTQNQDTSKVLYCDSGYYIDLTKNPKATKADCPNVEENPCKGKNHGQEVNIGGAKAMCCGGEVYSKGTACPSAPATNTCKDKDDGAYQSVSSLGGTYYYYCVNHTFSTTSPTPVSVSIGSCNGISFDKTVQSCCPGYKSDGTAYSFVTYVKGQKSCSSYSETVKPNPATITVDESVRLDCLKKQAENAFCGSGGISSEAPLAGHYKWDTTSNKCICDKSISQGGPTRVPLVYSGERCLFDKCSCWWNLSTGVNSTSISTGAICTEPTDIVPLASTKEECDLVINCLQKSGYSGQWDGNSCQCVLDTNSALPRIGCTAEQKGYCLAKGGASAECRHISAEDFICYRKSEGKELAEAVKTEQAVITLEMGDQCPGAINTCKCKNVVASTTDVAKDTFCAVRTNDKGTKCLAPTGATPQSAYEGLPCNSNGTRVCDKIGNCVDKTSLPVILKSEAKRGLALQSSAADTVSLSPSNGFYAITKDGTYCTEFKGDKYCFDAEAQTSAKIYIDTNQNGKYDKGSDVDFGADGVSLKVTQSVVAKKWKVSKGFNLISISLTGEQSGFTASSLLEYFNSKYPDAFYSIAEFTSGKWNIVGNRNGQSYGSTDFNILPGKGYLLKSKVDLEIEISGLDVTTAVPVALAPGWNLIGINGTTKTFTAESLLDSINATKTPVFEAVNVTQWPTDKQKYEGLQKEKDKTGVMQVYGFDFPIDSKTGYFVRVNKGSGNWTPQ